MAANPNPGGKWPHLRTYVTQLATEWQADLRRRMENLAARLVDEASRSYAWKFEKRVLNGDIKMILPLASQDVLELSIAEQIQLRDILARDGVELTFEDPALHMIVHVNE